MMQFDKHKAKAVLAELTLSAPSRRFADHWLSMLSEDGQLNGRDLDADIDPALQARTVVFEITPHAVRIKSAGAQIVGGCISRHQRWVVNTAGRVHFINELAVPCGLSADGLPMIATYVDTDSQGSMGRIPPKKGAMNIAPVFETYAIT